MSTKKLRIYHKPELHEPVLIISLDGWMNGGDVSTGTVEYLRMTLNAVPFASIDPENFYLNNFPGSMEFASLFRPHIKIKDGIIQSLDMLSNTFFTASDYNVILFNGKEPNLNWQGFADCFLNLCENFSVKEIFFIGSVSGLIPHSREPRFTAVVSHVGLQSRLEKLGIRSSQYEGPASFINYLTLRCSKEDLDMTVLVAEIPAYLQGYNPKCIETTVRCLSSLLELHLTCDDLRAMGDEYERRVGQLVKEQKELSERVQQLESIYDDEIFDQEMTDLKGWLQNRGIRLD